MRAKITYRGWAGHFICAHRCRFRLNSLVEYGDIRIVVSTVGLMEGVKGVDTETFVVIGHERYYETMAFHAKAIETEKEKFWDADVSRQVCFESDWCINEIEAENKATKMHFDVVNEVARKLESGKTLEEE